MKIIRKIYQSLAWRTLCMFCAIILLLIAGRERATNEYRGVSLLSSTQTSAIADTNWHTLTLRSTAAGIYCSVDGETEKLLSANIPCKSEFSGAIAWNILCALFLIHHALGKKEK